LIVARLSGSERGAVVVGTESSWWQSTRAGLLPWWNWPWWDSHRGWPP